MGKNKFGFCHFITFFVSFVQIILGIIFGDWVVVCLAFVIVSYSVVAIGEILYEPSEKD